MPKRIEAPENYGGTERPELFRKPDSKIPGGPSIPETPLHQEITPEETPLPSGTSISPEALPELELPRRTEIQPLKEKRPEQPPPRSREPLKVLLLEKIKEKWRKKEITKKEKEKCFAALKLWVSHGIISAAGTAAIGLSFGLHFWRTRNITSLLWKMRSDPSPVAYSLIIAGAVKLGTVLLYEKRYGVKFSMLSKLLSVPLGSAMPIEIVYTLGEGPWLVNEIRERYVEPPLARVRSGLQKIRNISRK